MTTTPIADLLGINTEKHPVAFRFTFRERVFVWVAPVGCLPETLMVALFEPTPGGLTGFDRMSCFAGSSLSARSLTAMMVGSNSQLTDLEEELVLAAARAAVKAQGGGK